MGLRRERRDGGREDINMAKAKITLKRRPTPIFETIDIPNTMLVSHATYANASLRAPDLTTIDPKLIAWVQFVLFCASHPFHPANSILGHVLSRSRLVLIWNPFVNLVC